MLSEPVVAVVLEVEDVARPKGKGKSPKPDPEDVPKTLFAIKGRPSWHAWLKEYADSIGMDVLGAIDNALRHQAKRDEFERPMPRRMGKPRE